MLNSRTLSFIFNFFQMIVADLGSDNRKRLGRILSRLGLSFDAPRHRCRIGMAHQGSFASWLG